MRGHSTTSPDSAGRSIDRVLTRIEAEVAAGRPIPIIGPVKGRILYLLTRAVKPRLVLELGTAVGYSTLLIAKAVRGGGRIVTVERDPTLAAEAVENLREAGVGDMVDVVVDEALATLKKLRGVYDLVFLDIEKRYYVAALEICVGLLRPGGALIADNVMWDELREFRDAILNHSSLESAIIPVGDGLALSIRA
ncbi:MAG: O-methyltransferase [Nitrososphaerota archaeon]